MVFMVLVSDYIRQQVGDYLNKKLVGLKVKTNIESGVIEKIDLTDKNPIHVKGDNGLLYKYDLHDFRLEFIDKPPPSE